MSRVDYCAVAHAYYDGEVWGDGDGLDGGVWPMKTTIVLYYGLGDLGCEMGIFPRCEGPGKCRMMVPGQKYHARVLCSRSEGLKKGQQRVEGNAKSMIPAGLFVRFLELHEQWVATQDRFASWCSKCGEGGDDLIMCDGGGCGRVQHRHCQHLCDPDAQEWWMCDLCMMKYPSA